MKDNNETFKVQDLDLVQLTKEFGSPLYVYNSDKIVSQITKLKTAFGGFNSKIKYAAKALTNINILKLVKNQGCGLDVVSIQEAHLGIKAGFEASDILFTPNSVSFDEIQEAVDLGLVINIDNISILEQFGNAYGDTKSCCIRFNPHIMAGGNLKISTGHIDSKFGISVYQIAHVLRIVKKYNIPVFGLHIHTGSDILDSEVYLKGAEILFHIAKDFPDLKFLDLGSGFKVAYKDGDIVTDLEGIGTALTAAYKEFCTDYGRDLELWFEPGKFIVSECGVLLVKANIIKTTPATVFVGVNSGMNHLLRPMMYDAYHEIVNISNPNGTNRVYSVVGNICETDTLGWDRKLPEVREGDILLIKNAGAYGFSMASNYNSRYRPAEVLIHKAEAKLIRKRETFEDLIRNQVEIDL